MSNSNIHEHIENYYNGKYNRKYEANNKALKNVINNENKRTKRNTYDSQPHPEEYFIDHSYDNARLSGVNSNYTKRSHLPQEQNNINNNYKNKISNAPQTNNDITKINTFTYYSEINHNNIGRSVSSSKASTNLQNTLNNPSKSRIDEKNAKNKNHVESDNKSKNNGNLIFINSNRNTSIKIINKSKNNAFTPNSNDENREQILKNDRRRNRNEVYISDYRQNNNNADKTKEKKYNKGSTKLNHNKVIAMSGFEISYESDKGERNTYNSYKRNKSNIINTNSNTNINNKYNNIYYSNINLDDNNYENEIFNTESNNSKTINNDRKNIQYKYKILKTNSSASNNLNNKDKKRININDSVEIKDLYNNKSVLITTKKKKNIKSSANINSRPLKSNNSNLVKNNALSRDNHNIDNISSHNDNDNNQLAKNGFNNNLSIDNPIVISSHNTISKTHSNNYFSNNNSSREKKKLDSNINRIKKYKFKNYHRKSDIKKIILIQSIYRAHLLNSRLNYNARIYQLLQSIYNALYIRKIYYWKFFINKISKLHTYKKLTNKSNKNNSKNKKRSNGLLNTNNKLLLKTKEVKMLHKELGDSFNIINDNNDLKLKLDDMIKENTELKNQICDNKNIEEKLKQLIVENKRNQNINAIIMKDNQQLAKRLKTIQDNRNNQLVIQYQKSFDFGKEDSLQFQSSSKLKYLYLKCLVFKKILKNRNLMKIFFNKYRNNAKKVKTYKIENNNIFIDNKKKINIQMAKNFNINFISQNDNYKNFFLYKLFIKKEKEKLKIISKFFYKFFFIAKNIKVTEEEEKKKNEEKKEIIKNKNEQKQNILKSIIDKYERNSYFLTKSKYREWKLRSVIFKMKAVAKEIKRKKKLKKKIRDKIAKETLNNLKNKTAMFQSAHEFSYKIDKTNKDGNKLKTEENKKVGINIIKEEDEKNENNLDEQEDSGDSLGLDD